MKCKYQKQYFDYASKKYQPFICDEDSLPSGYCVFHDEFFANNEQNRSFVRQKLNSKIDESISTDKDLFCIGYYIPDITISNTFSKNVYFIEAKFMGDISFRESEFIGSTDFSYAKFFTDHEILFSLSKFLGVNVTFEGAEFLNSIPHFNGMYLNVKEKINFASKFYKGADFSSTEFSSKIIQFANAEFHGSVEMNETKFIGFEHLYFNGIKFLRSDGQNQDM